MSQKGENYIPVAFAEGKRRQAFHVWGLTLVVVGLWTLAIVAAPVTRTSGLDGISNPLYTFFGYICHQLPERSFHILGEQFGVCSRCFGIYFGLVIGVVVYPLWRVIDTIEPVARFWLFLSLIPIGIDWCLTALGIWENTQASRLITGLVLGFACATFILPALVEIIRNFSLRNTRA
ncbi:hypothetical protein BH20ACI2_BH20ACI2_02790 [soil metagenome]